MALPLPVRVSALVTPPARPVTARARISSPPADVHDSYLGGFARGTRFVYNDAMQFVWWAPDTLPVAPEPVGYGGGAYGAGPYGKAASGEFGAGNYGRGPFGGS